MSGRIEAIEAMLARDGEDVFLRYSLGKEYAAAGDSARAMAELNRCIELDGGYVAAYVEAGKCLRASGDLGAARAVFERGLAVAEARGEGHAREHIRQQLESLGG